MQAAGKTVPEGSEENLAKTVLPLDRPSHYVSAQKKKGTGWLDLRSEDTAANRDLSNHRRSTWLYDDLLN
ncbi:MAG: hypothetical protein AAFY06_07730 [Pseudomonadota bacterium]